MPLQTRLRACLASLCALLSTACAPAATQTVRLTVPPGLLTCRPAPDVPGEPVTDADLAGWIIDLAEAGDDCRDKLARVRGLMEIDP